MKKLPRVKNLMECPFRKFHPSGIGVVTDFFDLGDFNHRGATNNATGGGNMAKAADYPVKPVMLVAGDDADRKPAVMELVGKLGFEPVDAGPLKNARLLEPFAMVWIDQAMKRGRGRDFAFAMVNAR